MTNLHYCLPYSQALNTIQFSPQSHNQMSSANTSSNTSIAHMYPKTQHKRGISENVLQRSSDANQSLNDQILSPNEEMKQQYSNKQFGLLRGNNNNSWSKSKSLNSNAVKQHSSQIPNTLLYYLPPKANNNKKTLVLDLDETLVHSAFRPFSFKSDMTLNVNVNHNTHLVHVLKRPYVDEFLERMSKHYELVVFTASISQYANPLLDQLDKKQLIAYRLFREHCINANGLYIKDLNRLRRDLKDVIILDNNPISYAVNQENGLPILTWHDDKADTELVKLIPLLEYLAYVDDAREFIIKGVYENKINYEFANELINKSMMIPNKHRIKRGDTDKEYYKQSSNNYVKPDLNNSKSRTEAPIPSAIPIAKTEYHPRKYEAKIHTNANLHHTKPEHIKCLHQKTNSCSVNTNPKDRPIRYASDYIDVKNCRKRDSNNKQGVASPPNISVNIVNNNISQLCINESPKENKINGTKKEEVYNPFIIPNNIINKYEDKKGSQLTIENDSDSQLTMDENLIQDNDHSRNNLYNKSNDCLIRSFTPNQDYCGGHDYCSKSIGRGEYSQLMSNEYSRNDISDYYYREIGGYPIQINKAYINQTIAKEKENVKQNNKRSAINGEYNAFKDNNTNYQRELPQHSINKPSIVTRFNKDNREIDSIPSSSATINKDYYNERQKMMFYKERLQEQQASYLDNKTSQVHLDFNQLQHNNIYYYSPDSRYEYESGVNNRQEEMQLNCHIPNSHKELQINNYCTYKQQRQNDKIASNKNIRNSSNDWKNKRLLYY